MKLLLDENLSARMADALSDLYPGSLHLRDCGCAARPILRCGVMLSRNGFMIASKDSDFAQRSLLLGAPPKVIWLRLGNCTSARAEFVLRNAVQRVAAFGHSEESCLVLTFPHRE